MRYYLYNPYHPACVSRSQIIPNRLEPVYLVSRVLFLVVITKKSNYFRNFAVENRAEELAQTSEKVLFELSLLSKFSQNLLIVRKISTSSTCTRCFISTLLGYHIANRCGCSVVSLTKGNARSLLSGYEEYNPTLFLYPMLNCFIGIVKHKNIVLQ